MSTCETQLLYKGLYPRPGGKRKARIENTHTHRVQHPASGKKEMKPVSSNVSEESRGFNSTEGVPQFIISDPSSHILKTCAEKQPKYLIQKCDDPNPKNHEQPNHSKPYLQPEASGTPAVTRTTKQAQRPQTFHPEFWSFRKLRYLFWGSLSFWIFFDSI